MAEGSNANGPWESNHGTTWMHVTPAGVVTLWKCIQANDDLACVMALDWLTKHSIDMAQVKVTALVGAGYFLFYRK